MIIQHNLFNTLFLAISEFVKSLVSANVQVTLEPTVAIEKGLFVSDVLVQLAKIQKCNPKDFLLALNNNALTIDWEVIEEKGLVYFNLKDLSKLSGKFDFNAASLDRELSIYLAPVNIHTEINYFRQNMFAYLYSKLANQLGINTHVYRCDNDYNFNLIEIGQLFDQEFNSNLPAKIDINKFSKTLNKIETKGWLLGFHSQERQLYHAILGSNLKLRSLPLSWEVQEGAIPEALDFWIAAKEAPFSAAVHVSQDLPAHCLDDFVVNSNEQANLVYFTKSIYNALRRVFELSLSHVPSFEETLFLFNAKQSLFYQRLIKRLWLLPFNFQAAVLELQISDFLSLVRYLLEDFQHFFNSPELRQRNLQGLLNKDEKEIISAVYALLNLCDSFLLQPCNS